MKDINKIFEEEPRDQLWNTIEQRLENKKSGKKLKLYRIASLAAMFVVLIASVSYFSDMINDHNPHLFASNEGFSSYMLEELENESEGLFNMASFDEIRNAYNEKFGAKSVIVLSGKYLAQDGEIAINISLKDYTYFLTFSNDYLPSMILDKVEDQTLFFSAEHYNLKLNIEPNGLKIIESNFLPEYKNFIFNKLNTI